MNPLNMILSDTIGRRAQVDLIDMRSQEYDGYTWILRYRDHLSGYSHVAPLFSKESIEVGFEVVKIMSSTVIPDILQSDNGGEFLGKCIEMVNEHLPEVHVVRGRARHPQSQGGIERSNKPFKDGVQAWMQEQRRLGKEEKEWKNWPFGVYHVNAAMNLRTSRSRDGLSPYQIFFGQKIRSKFKHAFSIVSDAAKTEWGLESLRLFASVMRTNGVNPTKEESIDAIQIEDMYFSVNLKVKGDELNDIPIFNQMRDEVLYFSSHALRSCGITEMLLDNSYDAEHEE